ncbi:hypothetical protein FBY40_0135 [Microbacterium sp. SLBN-154]|uniref:NHL repeat-containing protein n=1 Tax=Microbacterium sp. SLBN-154 TaxID=2768458 RepID=UPI0011504F1A|nr:NHL repeat-containing protein [Microbacterium sp. SLBN-154]TQK17658.1 hypothetical protein FBY40_0135 [Microbacterium sp. SLBN-154]
MIGNTVYEWTDVALDPPDSVHWAHPGLAVDSRGAVYVPDAAGDRIVRFDPDGGSSAIRVGVTDTHGLAVTRDGDLWIADHGHKFVPAGDGYEGRLNGGGVTRFGSDGRVLQQLTAPHGKQWLPSSVALHDFGRGSDGSVWVADGYGRSLVHRFSARGDLLWTADGAASGVAFSTPHGIVVDGRGPVPVLRVADRANRRVVTLSLDGQLIDVSGEGQLTSPSCLAVVGDLLVVTELFGSIVLMDKEMRVVAAHGTPLEESDQEPGWPNWRDRGAVRRPVLDPLSFRSPHGIAATPDGVIWVAEWFIGGRVSRLTPLR